MCKIINYLDYIFQLSLFGL